MKPTKLLLIFLFTVFLFGEISTASFQSSLYCEIREQQMVVATKPEKWLKKCSSYIENLNLLLQQKQQEILLILHYQEEKQDTQYRKEIYELKKQEFTKLMKYKSSLLASLESFEQNFFTQYQSLLFPALQNYLEDLEAEISYGHHAAGKEIPEPKRMIFLRDQIKTIKTILAAEKLEELMLQMPKYFYLKTQLEKWK